MQTLNAAENNIMKNEINSNEIDSNENDRSVLVKNVTFALSLCYNNLHCAI